MDDAAPLPFTAASGAAADARVSEILDWLAHPAGTEIERELRQTHDRLTAFADLPLSINQFHRILDLFQSRTDLLAAAAKRRLGEQDQPLTRELRQLVQSLDELQSRICDAYTRVLNDIEHRLVRNRRRDPCAVAARGLKALRERLELAAYVARPAPPRLWSRAHWLHRICTVEPRPPQSGAITDGDRVYRELLAFAAIQPERLSPVEVAAASDYLLHFASAVVILDRQPEAADYRLFWVDLGADSAPVALARRQPAAGQEPLYFSCTRLGTLAAEHLREIEAGTAPEHLGLAAEASGAPFQSLLHKLRESWAEPPTRHLVRRRQNYGVTMVAGLADLVHLLANDAEASSLHTATPSTWTVINESPSGYALMHLGGEIGSVRSGEVVAIRSADDKPWDVCIVCRVFSERPGRIEIGLQIVATNSSACPVRVAFRHAPSRQEAVAALWLPALAALRRHDAILVPSGTAATQRFVMAADDGRIRVIQGRILQASLRTASVELLEFVDDPYPL